MVLTPGAPALVDVEVAQVFRRCVLRGDLTASWARTAIGLLGGFPMERYGHDSLLPRIRELRDKLTAYAAAYVALAEGLPAPMITCDARLANASGIRAAIELVH